MRLVCVLFTFENNGTYGPTDQRTDGRTDGRTDRRTDTPSYRDARTHLIKRARGCRNEWIRRLYQGGKVLSRSFGSEKYSSSRSGWLVLHYLMLPYWAHICTNRRNKSMKDLAMQSQGECEGEKNEWMNEFYYVIDNSLSAAERFTETLPLVCNDNVFFSA